MDSGIIVSGKLEFVEDSAVVHKPQLVHEPVPLACGAH